ncbi:hypothetical protein FGW37_03625 [Streptomyces rectiverticillatus]|uniref:hypothetical protein n=1 Tax=Streptomyces rectiverticillatus TaxID=173860 RepID=UPI0015C3488F|nr:hypothetical protein [Streptomyces rectiverticillatus]QLE70817.1 hypothetical protein FGW37_03625 [Streptomyces rectiverticillatus]
MVRDLGLDEVVEHFTLDDDESALLRNKSGPSRLGHPGAPTASSPVRFPRMSAVLANTRTMSTRT